MGGTLPGLSLPLGSSTACVPKDFNRNADATFKQEIPKLTWRDAGAGGAVLDATSSVHRQRDAGSRRPLAVEATFRPHRNVLYRSRFRIQVPSGEDFDFVLQGGGTYDEHDVGERRNGPRL
mmetsp:Transcript_23152/g.72142  ORF Transcript_23152/g.72142 Transcript_23152/m.72142 type:complete len:121 (-) Transcript_23152:265-627(-)